MSSPTKDPIRGATDARALLDALVTEGPHDAIDRLASTLRKHDVVVDRETLAAAVEETFRSSSDLRSEPLTAGERSHRLASTERIDEVLSAGARAATRARVLTSRATAERSMAPRLLSTAQVSALTGRSPSSIRRSVGTGDLCAVNPGDQRGLLLPDWQFSDGRALPGISRILEALPPGTHPLVVERFMTAPRASLDDRSPADWLATGGAVDAIVQLADERSRA